MSSKKKRVRCLVCGAILYYDDNNTAVLVDHLNNKHAGIDVFRYLADADSSKSTQDTVGQKSGLKYGANGCGEPRAGRFKRETLRKIYKTTVETWRPGPNKIACPSCGSIGQPIIRTQKNKMAQNPLAAFFMLGCWPFCFLPFMMCNDDIVHLYCAKCSQYLGAYDKRNHCVTYPDVAINFKNSSRSAPQLSSKIS